jgi:hypothetical protein
MGMSRNAIPPSGDWKLDVTGELDTAGELDGVGELEGNSAASARARVQPIATLAAAARGTATAQSPFTMPCSV